MKLLGLIILICCMGVASALPVNWQINSEKYTGYAHLYENGHGNLMTNEYPEVGFVWKQINSTDYIAYPDFPYNVMISEVPFMYNAQNNIITTPLYTGATLSGVML